MFKPLYGYCEEISNFCPEVVVDYTPCFICEIHIFQKGAYCLQVVGKKIFVVFNLDTDPRNGF